MDGDSARLPTLITGTITEISTSFPESGFPDLIVAGYDRAFPLTVGKNSRTWTKASDSDAVITTDARGQITWLNPVAERLTDRLDTRVKVDAGRTRGRITIEFASEDDLERIAELLLRIA